MELSRRRFDCFEDGISGPVLKMCLINPIWSLFSERKQDLGMNTAYLLDESQFLCNGFWKEDRFRRKDKSETTLVRKGQFQSITCLIAIAVYNGLRLDYTHLENTFVNFKFWGRNVRSSSTRSLRPKPFGKGASSALRVKKQAPRLWN